MTRLFVIFLSIVLLIFSSQSKIYAQNSVTTQKNDNLPLLEFKELSINGISLYMSRSAILKQFGKPLSEKRAGVYPCGGATRILRYSGLILTLEKDNDSRNYEGVAVTIVSSKWSLSGIKIGADKKKVLAKFKDYNRNEIKKGKSVILNYGNGDGGTNFTFLNNKLVSMKLESNWC